MKGWCNGGRVLAAPFSRCAIHVDCNMIPAWIARSVRFSCLEKGGAVLAAHCGGIDAVVRAGLCIAAQTSPARMLGTGTYTKTRGLAAGMARLTAWAAWGVARAPRMAEKAFMGSAHEICCLRGCCCWRQSLLEGWLHLSQPAAQRAGHSKSAR